MLNYRCPNCGNDSAEKIQINLQNKNNNNIEFMNCIICEYEGSEQEFMREDGKVVCVPYCEKIKLNPEIKNE
jgi:Zn ribbon nucleic-acid-binding protein